jgi:hypothetical protein
MELEDNIIIMNHMNQLDKTELNQISSITYHSMHQFQDWFRVDKWLINKDFNRWKFVLISPMQYNSNQHQKKNEYQYESEGDISDHLYNNIIFFHSVKLKDFYLHVSKWMVGFVKIMTNVSPLF